MKKHTSIQEEMAALSSKLKTIETPVLIENPLGLIKTGYNAAKGGIGGMFRGANATQQRALQTAANKTAVAQQKFDKTKAKIDAAANIQSNAARVGDAARTPVAAVAAGGTLAGAQHLINQPSGPAQAQPAQAQPAQAQPAQAQPKDFSKMELASLIALLEPYKDNPEVAAVLTQYKKSLPK